MWNYWCIFPSSSGKLAFLAPWENQGKEAEWKCSPSSVIELDFTRWIARTRVYPNYIAKRFQSCCSHSGQRQLGSALSYQDPSLWEDVYNASRKQINATGRHLQRLKSGLWFGPRIHEITDLTAKTRAEQNTAVFSVAHTSFNLAEYNTDSRDCLWLFVWPSIFLTRVFFLWCNLYDLLMRRFSVSFICLSLRPHLPQTVAIRRMMFRLTFPRLGLHRYLRLKTQRARTRKTRARTRATRWYAWYLAFFSFPTSTCKQHMFNSTYDVHIAQITTTNNISHIWADKHLYSW